jgi:hypothetical protein
MRKDSFLGLCFYYNIERRKLQGLYKNRVTKSTVTPQNLLRSKQRKGKLKKSVKIRNKKPVKIA